MNKKIICEYEIVDNSDTIERDIWKNPFYCERLQNTDDYKIIIYEKILTPTGHFLKLEETVSNLANYKLSGDSLLPDLFYEFVELEGYKNDWIPDRYLDKESNFLLYSMINRQWKEYKNDFGSWDKQIQSIYYQLIQSITNHILLLSEENLKIEENFPLQLDHNSSFFSTEIMRCFFRKLLEVDSSKVEDFLSFHLNRFEGEKKVFLDELSEFLDYNEIDKYTPPNMLQRDVLNDYNPDPYKNYRAALQWIDSKRIEVVVKPKKDAPNFTTKQQILILHYLGKLDDNFGLSQNQLAKFLGLFLTANKDNVNKGLINRLKASKTEENLNSVRDLFEEFDLDTSPIVADIDKLREEKKKRG
jgi:hypothetical protein